MEGVILNIYNRIHFYRYDQLKYYISEDNVIDNWICAQDTRYG
jgi:hypothetical protein